MDNVFKGVSIHAPREGRDACGMSKRGDGREFQSTRPVKGATSPQGAWGTPTFGFNPRAP